MKKVLFSVVLVFAVLVTLAGGSFAADVTPVKLSLIPQVGIPAAQIVHGLDLGIIASVVDEVQGVQLTWIYGGVNKKMVGLQASLIDIAGDVEGVQYGFYNDAKNMKGIQLGFVNVAGNLKGIQLGLVNIIKKGSVLPVMVIANANF